MRNILAIANKEIRGYFASPIAWVTVGFFALLVGGFYITSLAFFLQRSMQFDSFSQMGQQAEPINVNQWMIRPLFMNIAVINLFVLPMLTMRTYSEEKRSGTIELLLTSPVTDFQIIVGKFLGTLALYGVMLLVTFVHIGILFVYGSPEWQSILSGYLGLFLLGATFLAVGLFISSTTKNQIVAGVLTFAVLLLLWISSWFGESAPPTVQAVLRYLSVVEHLDDFSKGVVDTSHLVYYLSFIAFALFLTAKSVDTERWRG
ncbi:MAG TPA: ABC transporter permease [Vicinamibacterales bacterium]|jgi:ABC-2 type transport system permease protein